MKGWLIPFPFHYGQRVMTPNRGIGIVTGATPHGSIRVWFQLVGAAFPFDPSDLVPAPKEPTE